MVASLSFLIHVCLYLTCLSVSLHIQPTLKKFFIETHGCQMNLADSDIVRSILLTEGYELSDDLEAADLILTNTCAIRENAEDKIWQRLKYFQSIRKKAYLAGSKPKGYPLIGVLGCMAERLKSKLIDEEGVDFVAGPDSYRSLPVLIKSSNTDQTAAQEMLALDETYADIAPVRLAEGNTHAFVTITRGCDNHCAFCIVPYTRGRERSRPVNTILSEICQLREEGFNEVVLLGQNVNSYWDVNSPSEAKYHDYQFEVADGFRTRKNIVKVTKEAEEHDGGVRFGELLARVAEIDPELRVRFQSPHPKDFGDELLRLIAATPNICNSLHIPAQHGSTAVLERMKRGYSREAFVSLVSRARHIIGRDVDSALGLSTDMIAGFCGETHEDHLVRSTLYFMHHT
jgi:MiaB/RimO family radical SAM methylthiotransferase